MSFHVEPPSHDTQKKCYEVLIRNGPVFERRVVPFTPTFEADDKQRFDEFISEFLKLASPYFSKPLDKTIFLQRITHCHSTDDLSGETILRAVWIPAKVLFYPSIYEIHWTLTQLEEKEIDTSGIEIDMVPSDKVRAAPILSQSEQKRIRQKIRQSRLKCAVARMHLERLTEKYYRKYGGFDGLSDADSELSSDLEFQENAGPRKI